MSIDWNGGTQFMHLAPTYVEQGFDSDGDGEDDDGPHVDESNHLTHLPR